MKLSVDCRISRRGEDLQYTASCSLFPLVLLGPSGAGKSTLLECLAGILHPEDGAIEWDGDVFYQSSTHTFIPPQQRRVGYVMQDGALFPHLNVRDNVAFGVPDRKKNAQVAELLEELALTHLAGSLPREISGGERSRVAMARALASRPQLLLLDEAFAGLDPPSAESCRRFLTGALQAQDLPCVMVTHERDEALRFAKTIWLIHGGRCQQSGSPKQIFSQPANPAVAQFVGTENLIEANVVRHEAGSVILRAEEHELMAAIAEPLRRGTSWFAALRPGDVHLVLQPAAATSARNRLRGRVISIESLGSMFRVRLDVGFPLAAHVTSQALEDLRLQTGQELFAVFKASSLHLIPREAKL